MAAIEAIDKQLYGDATSSVATTNSSRVCLLASAKCSDIVLDSGAGRHLHNVPADFSSLRRCVPQTLTGFTGNHVTVS